MKIYCYKCEDYSEFENGICEACNTEHPAKGKNEPIKSHYNDPEYDGLPHDSDCFWVN